MDTDSTMQARTQPDSGVGAQRGPSAAGPIRHVLTCLDRSAAAEAGLFHALAIARACGASVTALHVLETSVHRETGTPDAVQWAVYRQEALAYIERVAERSAAAGGLRIAPAVVEGDPATQICDWVDANEADLAVVSLHGGKEPTRWSLPSTARKLIEALRCSVLVVPATSPKWPQHVRYRRVVVPVDGSAWSERAVTVARRLADEHDSELVLAHAVPRPELTCAGPFSPEDLDLRDRLARRNLRVGREYLQHLRRRTAGVGPSIRTELVSGDDVRDELMRLIAKEHPDLVVVSSCGSSGRIDQPLGSVASYLLTHAFTPLLVLRPAREGRTDVKRVETAELPAPRLPAQAG
jgi:nucleotide-binding universal stress UspA family protein